ncbi:MAG: hypothetical protein K5985_01220 [Lachnospiraceae bacterium]|nr:hypothetical protein [Lachnospiraceae bacterium]
MDPVMVNSQGTRDEDKKTAKRNTLLLALTAFFTGGMFLIVLISALIVIPNVMRVMSRLDGIAAEVEETLEELDNMAENVEKTSNHIDAVVEENSEALTRAVESLSEIDFHGLSEAVNSVSNVIGTMSKIGDFFR